MSTATSTTAGPTLTSPEALAAVAELREALRLANERILDTGDLLHQMGSVVVDLTGDMRTLLVLHMEGDPVGVYEQLEGMVKKYVRSMPKGTGLGSAAVH